MNSFNPICLLLCLATLTLAYDFLPLIVEQPESVNGDPRIPLILTCRAIGIPEPTYYWEKNGALFDVDSDDRASLDGGNLVFDPITPDDDGQYQCFAKNRRGTAMSQKIRTSLAFMDQFEDTAPKTVQVGQGEPLKLHCGGTRGAPNGNPAPLIYWTDAAPEPTPIGYDARINQDPEGNLVFSNVIASDAKGYYCRAINKVIGSSQKSSKITLLVQTDLPAVESAARLVTHPAASEVAFRSQSFKLKCIAYGYQTPVITWKRGEEQVQSGGRVSIEEFGQGLVISAVENSDKGTYTCIASNTGGDDEFSIVVTVEYYVPVPPSIVEQPESYHGDRRIPQTLMCRATGRPEPTYYWEKDGALFDVNSNDHARLDGGNLVFDPVTQDDDGQYQCFANNMLGTAMSQKIRTSLAFLDQFENTAPETVLGIQGEPLKLPCGGTRGIPNSNPAPFTYWTDAAPKPTPIRINARVYSDSEGNLVFSNIIESDAKGYYCGAINNIIGQYQRSSKVTLSVMDLPALESPASLVTKPAAKEVAIRTESFKLTCIAYGYPTPVITWKRGEEQLLSEGRVSIKESGQGVVISNVENSDKGTYTCIASNTGGDDEFSTVVTVESAPYFSDPAPSDETKGPGESVDIECRSEGVPVPTVDWLVNGQPWADFQSNIDTERWTVVTGDPQLATISITDLQTTDSNVFQCIATNKYKEELTSVVLNVISNIPARIPSFTPLTRKLSVVQNDSAMFICHFEGRPTPTITWTFKGSLLTNKDKYTINGTEGSLLINNVMEVDGGEYECRAENAIDGVYHEVTGSATLTVLGFAY